MSYDMPDSFHPHTIPEAVLATLSFFSLFQRPLTLPELKEYLLRFHADAEELRQVCKEMPAITSQQGYYCLRGEENIIAAYLKQGPLVEQRLRRARRFAKLFQMMPFIRGVFLCNNLAWGTAGPESDIDLLVVTDAKHLYLARFLLTGILHALGVRRHGRKISNRFCLSFYVTEDNLDFEPLALPEQDIYLAYWTRSLLPLCGREIYEQAISENKKWLTNYFNVLNLESFWKRSSKPKRLKFSEKIQTGQEMFWHTGLGRWLEHKIIRMQKKRIQEHYRNLRDKSGTIISDHMLKFHDQDRRRQYQELWLKKLSTIS